MKYCQKGILRNKGRPYVDVCCKILVEKGSVPDVLDLVGMNSALAVLERGMPEIAMYNSGYLRSGVYSGIKEWKIERDTTMQFPTLTDATCATKLVQLVVSLLKVHIKLLELGIGG